MSFPSFRRHRSFAAAAFGAFAALIGAVSSMSLHAQELPPGVRLGMTVEELQAALPAAERVQRPQRLAGGLAGTWRAPPSVMAGLAFEPTFYFAGTVLRRVEWVALAQAESDRGAAAFAELVGWGRERFGAEMASRDPGSAYASWVAGEADVYAQHVDDPRRASVRLVYKTRQLKDAGEL